VCLRIKRSKYISILYKHHKHLLQCQAFTFEQKNHSGIILRSDCTQTHVLSSSGKMKLVGRGSGERNKQEGGAQYVTGSRFMALDTF
jgi:hypothetical protein